MCLISFLCVLCREAWGVFLCVHGRLDFPWCFRCRPWRYGLQPLSMQGRFGSEKYAKEELVAELGAARVSYELGFDSRILSNSAAYLDSWIAALKQEPSFILTVMNDVEKASKLILDKVAV